MTDRSLSDEGKWLRANHLQNDPRTVHMNDGRPGRPIPDGPSALLCVSAVENCEGRTAEAQRVAEGAARYEPGVNAITGQVVDAAMKVHSVLGPGLLESAYEACLAHELTKRSLLVARQVSLPVVYDGVELDAGYRIDLLVEDQVVVELKTVSRLLPIHEAQLLSHLRLGRYRVGLLINFHVARLRDGIRRLANGL